MKGKKEVNAVFFVVIEVCLLAVIFLDWNFKNNNFYDTILLVLCFSIMIFIVFLFLFNIYTNQKSTLKYNLDIISKVSHEIRTPISGMLGIINVLKNSNLDEKSKGFIYKMESQVSYMLQLVNNQLESFKIQDEKMGVNPEYFKLSDLVSLITSNVDGLIMTKNINLIIEEKNIVDDVIYTDKVKLCQILLNLLSNAIKFSENFQKVKILLKQNIVFNRIFLQIIVEDEGCGMSEDFIAKIYDKYSQEKNNLTCNNIGSGLGLNITKMLVDLLKGNISISSKLGEGTKVIVDLCVCEEYQILKIKTMPLDYKFENKRILLVEDNIVIQEVTKEILNHLGIVIDIANNGVDAIRLYEESSINYYDLILMDINMPKMNGLVCSKEIRNIKRKDNNLVIIALSCDNLSLDIKRYHKSIINNFLVKPYTFNDMANLLYTYLGDYVS